MATISHVFTLPRAAARLGISDEILNDKSTLAFIKERMERNNSVS